MSSLALFSLLVPRDASLRLLFYPTPGSCGVPGGCLHARPFSSSLSLLFFSLLSHVFLPLPGRWFFRRAITAMGSFTQARCKYFFHFVGGCGFAVFTAWLLQSPPPLSLSLCLSVSFSLLHLRETLYLSGYCFSALLFHRLPFEPSLSLSVTPVSTSSLSPSTMCGVSGACGVLVR